MITTQRIKKITIAAMIAGVSALSVASFTGVLITDKAAAAAVTKDKDNQALTTLNSFYKLALKGQFPGGMKGLTLGTSTRQDVQDQIGKAEAPGKDADAFDVYHAEMGHPGYAISYKLNKIREMRYFGTNIERQNNIGGITQNMLYKAWGMPNSAKTIHNGKLTQKKIVYNRGDYQLSFIFNSTTELDHINLTHK
ncbi:YjgB family protein [Paenibacillus sp. 2TAB23]|uniref:YjgB family protein n=1 Tax=Paenibacillus sp. 2TAB23 TaxID=3233004 RepID=UPI003F977DF0